MKMIWVNEVRKREDESGHRIRSMEIPYNLKIWENKAFNQRFMHYGAKNTTIFVKNFKKSIENFYGLCYFMCYKDVNNASPDEISAG